MNIRTALFAMCLLLTVTATYAEQSISHNPIVGCATKAANDFGKDLQIVTNLKGNIWTTHALLGWHLTWKVEVDLSTTPPTTHDTFDGRGPLFRTRAPFLLIWKLMSCGTSWKKQVRDTTRIRPKLALDNWFPPKRSQD